MATVGQLGAIVRWEYDSEETASRFLDRVYNWLNKRDDNVQAYTYGQKWILENSRTKEVLDHIGTEYCKSEGRVQDSTPISAAGIMPGDKLRVVALDHPLY